MPPKLILICILIYIHKYNCVCIHIYVYIPLFITYSTVIILHCILVIGLWVHFPLQDVECFEGENNVLIHIFASRSSRPDTLN